MSDQLFTPAARDRLRAIIQAKSVLSGNQFRLASGRTSSIFFDMKQTLFDPEGANLIGDGLLDLLAGFEFDAVGGLAMGAVPVVSALVMKSWPLRPILGFSVRKETKDHGTQKLIEGPLVTGARVVILDDVSTTAGSSIKAIEAVRSIDCEVVGVVTIVDRKEGAEENLAKLGLTLTSLYTRDDFVAK
ncbi:Orotate phosphoribosyltransferase [uncultured Gammaproteobacteria bacterium]